MAVVIQPANCARPRAKVGFTAAGDSPLAPPQTQSIPPALVGRRIAFVHDWLTGLRGGEKCLAPLCRLFPEAQLYTLLHHAGSTSPEIERMSITTSWLQRLPSVHRYYRLLLPLFPQAIEAITLPADIDLVVSFSHAVAKAIRVPDGVPHVSYCFTPMRYAWHLRDQYLSEHRGENDGRTPQQTAAWPRPFTALKHRVQTAILDRLRTWDAAVSHRVTDFVAISRTVAERIEECYGRESTIIHPPVDTAFYTPAAMPADTMPADTPREDFYVCVSALVPYKRIELAMAACERLGKRLVIIGSGPDLAKLRRLASPGVTLLGWQSDDVIRDHLRRAKALLFPGEEDFGIVPLEAQACGTPVIAFGRGGATETILDAQSHAPGSGLFFGERTTASLIAAIRWFEAHPERFSPQVCRAQAERFAAERFETELLGHLAAVVSAHCGSRAGGGSAASRGTAANG